MLKYIYDYSICSLFCEKEGLVGAHLLWVLNTSGCTEESNCGEERTHFITRTRK